MFAPHLDLPLVQGKGHMTLTMSTVGRHWPGYLLRGGGIEEEEHGVAAAEEDVPAFDSRVDLETQHATVELLSGNEIVGVQTGFKYLCGAHWIFP
jgi:hypothetical protein